jgi:NADH-quinone oxidoreductase subunit M
MQWFYEHILSVIIFLPLLSALLSLLIADCNFCHKLHIAVASLVFLLSLYLWKVFDTTATGLQFFESYVWIPSAGIRYIVGVDGINLMLVVLTTFLVPISLISIISSKMKNKKAFLSLIMFLETGMLGALVAFDLVFFYVFWEVMLIPMYFMIGIWGGAERIYATTKFVIYTVFGSLLMLVAAMALYVIYYKQSGIYSTSLLDLYKVNIVGMNTELLLFAAFALAFAIKVPIWPFHTWLPHAHTQAPTVGSVILAGVLLKMGTYGLLRFAIPLFPNAVVVYAPFISCLGVIGIIYGALMAWMQEDAKKMIAYSSVSHLGYVVIGCMAFMPDGLNTEALVGASYQMINHGISTGALFFLIGMIYDRRHTRMLDDFGGLAKSMPWFSVMLIIATLGSVGLPGTGGFIGEFLVLLGVFTANPLVAVFACFGVLLGAIYMLNLCKKILFGPIDKEENKNLMDLSKVEFIYITPLCALIIIMGIAPNLFLRSMNTSTHYLAKNYKNYTLKSQKTQLSQVAVLKIDK